MARFPGFFQAMRFLPTLRSSQRKSVEKVFELFRIAPFCVNSKSSMILEAINGIRISSSINLFHWVFYHTKFPENNRIC